MEKAQFEWGLGTVQKQQAAAARQYVEEMASAPFARTADDPELEMHKKSIIRDGDPMADYFLSKESDIVETNVKATEKKGIKLKPIYNGPAPAPNRFGIRPGYRWDAIDRGNQFERSVFLHASNARSSIEDEHRWRSSDL